MSVKKIQQMSYPDFIGILGLENTSIADSFAVDYWIFKSNITKNSHILEIACSTGFNIRHCIRKTKAHGIGIDISKLSIQSAQEKAKQDKINRNVKFKMENAEQLSFPSNTFTHVISGMGFAFINNRDLALKEVVRVLSLNGYLLTATPYYKKQPPINLLKKIEKTFKFQPSISWNYNWWMQFFSRFFTLQSETSILNPISLLNNTSIRNQIDEFVFNGNHKLKNCNAEVKNACVERLIQIHLTINKNSQHQIGKLQVWKLKSSCVTNKTTSDKLIKEKKCP